MGLVMQNWVWRAQGRAQGVCSLWEGNPNPQTHGQGAPGGARLVVISGVNVSQQWFGQAGVPGSQLPAASTDSN